MQGREEDVIGHADFNDLAAVHNRDPVRNIGHHTQVMGDVNDGHVLLFLQAADQVQNLGLDGNVQGGGGFIADEDLGTAGYGDGDDHALAHAAGKLMRILTVAALRVRNADSFQNPVDFFTGRFALQALMQLHAFLNLVADGFQGVQTGHRILGDHGNLLTADLQPVFF